MPPNLAPAQAVADECRNGTFNITAPDGRRDGTLGLVAEYLEILT